MLDAEGVRRQVQDTLAEIEERGEAVRELEKSLLDLHQIFLDMAVLVEAQGEMLDNIEAQVRLVLYTQEHGVGIAGGDCSAPSMAHLHDAQLDSCTSSSCADAVQYAVNSVQTAGWCALACSALEQHGKRLFRYH